MNVVEKNARFKTWESDLEERLARHLYIHPEADPQPERKYRVTIDESPTCKGAWNVWVNNIKYHTFFGVDAHQRAMTAMKDLLDQNQ
jgi:hypothetical protein